MPKTQEIPLQLEQDVVETRIPDPFKEIKDKARQLREVESEPTHEGELRFKLVWSGPDIGDELLAA